MHLEEMCVDVPSRRNTSSGLACSGDGISASAFAIVDMTLGKDIQMNKAQARVCKETMETDQS